VLVQVPLLGRLLSPRLSLTIDDAAAGGKIGIPMEARIRECLQSFRDQALSAGEDDEYELDSGRSGEAFSIVVAEESSLRNAIAKAREVNERSKAVAAVFDVIYALLPIQRLTLSGVLDPPAVTAASATLTLDDDARLAAATTLSSVLPAKPSAADYLSLSAPAAVWIQYEVVRILKPDEVEANAGESNAALRQGLERRLAGDEVGARLAYGRAVGLDSRNWAAHVNLAVSRARSTDYELAIQILEDALIDMREAQP
jgi:hypothetical protein